MIPKYQVNEVYKNQEGKFFHVIKVEPLNNKVFVLEIIDGYINPKKDFVFTENELSSFQKVERDKGIVLGSLNKVERGGHDLHLIELIAYSKEYKQMYFTEKQFEFVKEMKYITLH